MEFVFLLVIVVVGPLAWFAYKVIVFSKNRSKIMNDFFLSKDGKRYCDLILEGDLPLDSISNYNDWVEKPLARKSEKEKIEKNMREANIVPHEFVIKFCSNLQRQTETEIDTNKFDSVFINPDPSLVQVIKAIKNNHGIQYPLDLENVESLTRIQLAQHLELLESGEPVDSIEELRRRKALANVISRIMNHVFHDPNLTKSLYAIALEGVESLKFEVSFFVRQRDPNPRKLNSHTEFFMCSFALVLLIISLSLPVEKGKYYMRELIGLMGNRMREKYGGYTQESTETAVIGYWHAFYNTVNHGAIFPEKIGSIIIGCFVEDPTIYQNFGLGNVANSSEYIMKTATWEIDKFETIVDELTCPNI